jgi:hypothetical protein
VPSEINFVTNSLIFFSVAIGSFLNLGWLFNDAIALSTSICSVGAGGRVKAGRGQGNTARKPRSSGNLPATNRG